MAKSLVFSSFFRNQYFSLCVLNMIQTFASISSPWFGRRERESVREREISPAGSKPSVQTLFVNTVCLGELELFIWEDVNPPPLIWALGSDLIWELKFKGQKEERGRRGTKEWGVGDGAHSPLAMGSHSFVRKAVHFWRPDAFFILRCEDGLGSEFSLPVCFYKCVGCSANSVQKHFR